jgi:hypothetical protein
MCRGAAGNRLDVPSIRLEPAECAIHPVDANARVADLGRYVRLGAAGQRSVFPEAGRRMRSLFWNAHIVTQIHHESRVHRGKFRFVEPVRE